MKIFIIGFITGSIFMLIAMLDIILIIRNQNRGITYDNKEEVREYTEYKK